MHDRKTWSQEYDRLYKQADRYRKQEDYFKEIEIRMQAHKVFNEYWSPTLIGWALITLEQYRLAVIAFKFAQKVLMTCDQQLQ